VDWKALFIQRYGIDGSVAQLLDSILGSQTGRIEKFRAVIEFGYDAKDTLLRNCQVQECDDYLARRCVYDNINLSHILGSLELTCVPRA
jgi:F-box protein 21